MFGGAGGPQTPASQPAEQTFAGEGLSAYLETMRALVEGDTVTQTEVFQDTLRQAELAPTTTNRLKLGLAWAMPGHPASDPVQAQRLLSELLAVNGALLPEERALAAIQLEEVDQRMILEEQARRLTEAHDAALVQQNSDSARRLEAALSENQRLRSELADAQQKLEAITSIERSIRERGNDTNSP
jgi:hypothetical protein